MLYRGHEARGGTGRGKDERDVGHVVGSLNMESDMPRGGVQSLLRMAALQCEAAVAFSAVRHVGVPPGIAIYPDLTPGGPWTIEAVEDLASQTLSDEHLRAEHVLVWTRRTPFGRWHDRDHAVRMATAALCDPGASGRPWGVLCVAEPTSGDFAPDQLNLLAGLGARTTAHLRARQRLANKNALPGGVPAPSEAGAGAVPPAKHVAGAEQALRGGVLDEPKSVRLSQALSAAPPQRDDLSASGRRLEPAGHPQSRPADSDRTRAAHVARSDTPTSPRTRGLHDVFDALGPDPDTGLAGLPSLVGHLGEALGEPGPSGAGTRSGESVVVLLVRLDGALGPLSPEELIAIAQTLQEHLRASDVLARVGDSTFGVLVTLPAGAGKPAALEQRLLGAIREVAERARTRFDVRSAFAVVHPGATGKGPDAVVRDVVARLESS